jgi:hypothetical protein
MFVSISMRAATTRLYAIISTTVLHCVHEHSALCCFVLLLGTFYPSMFHYATPPSPCVMVGVMFTKADLLLSVFLDESNIVKLGDFGLSKALPQASLASTYVGVRTGAVSLN